MAESTENDEKLIDEVRRFPVVYNPKDKNHKDAQMVANSWISIGDAVDMSVEDCKRRWDNLKKYYVKERADRNLPSGAGYKKRKAPWPLYETMLWLSDYITQRRRHTNLTQQAAAAEEQSQSSLQQPGDGAGGFGSGDDYLDEEVVVDDVFDGRPASALTDDNSSTSSVQTGRVSKQKKKNQEMDLFEQTILAQLQKPEQPKSEDDLFGMQIAESLKGLPPQQNAFAKMKIQELLYQIKFGHVVPPAPSPMLMASYPQHQSDSLAGYDTDNMYRL